jgi:hypothetical protein
MAKLTLFTLLVSAIFLSADAFSGPGAFSLSALSCRTTLPRTTYSFQRKMANDDGVVELADNEEAEKSPESASAAPFLSQGGISEEALNPDLSDPKQTRVIIYIILSLIPVLFLIPLMIGSRDLIPLDAIPPVELN